ncbi:DnaJ domain-containing protein [Arthrobacter polaris]|uniref:DnaJ domain-containing protein n=1 Tax=Arthrobacter polaris TaxID=2813727 RepID=UPI0038992B34|nr:DnaJ domain-containing protein [Arthrobacter polaris]
MAEVHNPYTTLRSGPEAPTADIGQAYRSLLLQYHPDSHPSRTTATVDALADRKIAASHGHLCRPPIQPNAHPTIAANKRLTASERNSRSTGNTQPEVKTRYTSTDKPPRCLSVRCSGNHLLGGAVK